MKKFICLLLFISSLIHSALPEPYDSIDLLPFDSHGWFSNEHALNKLMENKSIQTVIEIGSWLGYSTRFFATKVQPSGKVYAVDNWKGSIETLNDPHIPHLYQQFLSNTIHANLCSIIIPVRMDSLEAAEALNKKADLIYIDAGLC